MTSPIFSILLFAHKSPWTWRPVRRHADARSLRFLRQHVCCHTGKSDIDAGSLDREVAAAQLERRPYRIDKSKLTPVERQKLRLRSRAIPLVADFDPLDIIFEDDTYLVVNKPSFIKMHPSHRFEGGSLLNRAIGYLGYVPRLLHRLDMHTTGVVVLAKKKDVCTPVMKQFEQGKVKKQYICVVDGMWTEPLGHLRVVNAPIQRHEVSFVREVGTSKDNSSKPALTEFRVLDKSPQSSMMLLQAAPKTGRTHQIRVHALHSGVPIVGDDLYNPKEHEMYSSYEEISQAAHNECLLRYGDGNPLRRGLKLHAWKIELVNPETCKPMLFCAAAPAHMARLLKQVGMEIPE